VHEDHISDDLKKHVILGAISPNQSTLGVIFACIFREFAQIFRDFARVFTDFAQISIDFARIFRDFARIFTKSKLLGVRSHPLHPPPPTPLMWSIVYRGLMMNCRFLSGGVYAVNARMIFNIK